MDYLKLAHSLFNLVIMLFFIQQGWRGLKIRKLRVAGLPPDGSVIRGHRTNGPRLAILALCGYLVGATTAFIDHGHIFHYPSHFLTGTLLILLIGTTYLLSRRIKGRGPGGRTVHAALGVVILTLYPIQVLLGLSVLL
jgi:hypothetical protein